jgi:2-C-methyl-D-erythritol 2,4-cyclodiphosphate synthase
MSSVRTGIGYDVHRFAAGRPLMLGGIEIPHEQGLEGHSDADVLLHAITDALLGAAALGDIGTHFPPSDPAFRNASSDTFLTATRLMLESSAYAIDNVDCTLIAEAPRIQPYCRPMREAIAAALSLTVGQISVKATTNEGLGYIGRGEGIAALAIATISRADPGGGS